ncbi:glutamate-rich WD repeat containing [Gloeophyllum trabeum ATCC 11539]|uniref:Glutamate-rich WD repeat-containing protein 1 n=1 Tax=Gloeophyllum trabeum (strain ATCC 11539 / FP-39264 / Madison 617) TaxID=670483 RepID=S7RZQ7_GLOTA|nr:glutamate-rich WD repeat containing [Gloeophyllum trabeum ATCC 11539]EPQ60500.1 glutamate-rich WD repeat containing [Gloeophyllum trabeum ATCC 11539]
MSKRTVTEVTAASTSSSEPYSKVAVNGDKRKHEGADEMGEFEDAWEDEIESDEDAVDGGEDGMDVDQVMPAIEDTEDQPAPAKDVYIPGTHVLGEDEVLEPDDSVYEMRHSLKVYWPCLSFDVLRDNLGDERQRYPATAYIVSGTQADTAKNNEVVVYKLSSLHRTQKDEEDSDDENDDDEDLDEDPVLEFRTIPHHGGVNRVRAQPLPPSTPLPPVSQPYYTATWAETGKVHVWDIRPLIESLDTPGYTIDKSRSHTPAYTVNSHGRAEGFAMDWASSGSGSSGLRLLTGDVQSKIYLTTVTPSGFNTFAQPFTSHTSSVEDLQWSPSEPTVFASCSADQSVQIWDVRSKGRKSIAGIEAAHESDVNVISWNRSTSYLLLSGGDEGGIKVWDLRNVQKKGSSTPAPSPVASFSWHKAPITSIEWHPTEDSIFAASGADDQVTLWDLAVEQDDEQDMDTTENQSREVPPQLLFVHQGQRDVKEVHWHPQIPGAVISTALDGFNIFKTISV